MTRCHRVPVLTLRCTDSFHRHWCHIHRLCDECAAPGGRVASILVEMEQLVAEALQAAFPAQQEKPLVATTRDSKKFGGDYQCNNAMSLFGKLKGKVSA